MPIVLHDATPVIHGVATLRRTLGGGQLALWRGRHQGRLFVGQQGHAVDLRHQRIEPHSDTGQVYAGQALDVVDIFGNGTADRNKLGPVGT